MRSFIHASAIFVLLLISTTLFAQPSIEQLQRRLNGGKTDQVNADVQFKYCAPDRTQASIYLSAQAAVGINSFAGWISDNLGCRNNMDALIQNGPADNYFGTSIIRLQQYFKGIKVEHGVVKAAAAGDRIHMIQMEFYPLKETLPAAPVITEAAALQKAMNHVNAAKYAWQAFPGSKHPAYQLPKGELVFVQNMFSDTMQFCLAYKFDLYAVQPSSRKKIYVDAITGKVVFKDDVMKHSERNRKRKNQERIVNKAAALKMQASNWSALTFDLDQPPLLGNVPGIADTRYSGTVQNFFTEFIEIGRYELKGSGLGNNTIVETRNNLDQDNVANADPFFDADNYWSAAEFPNNVNMALDAHWGGIQAAHYWWKVHGRKSYDNNNGKINIYAFYREDLNEKYDNAQWNGNELLLGEGGFPPDQNKPWASVDLIGHELGHAICQYTANLVYNRESGALNEGFSDIWGACLENFINDSLATTQQRKNLWLFGEDISYQNQVCLRSMSDPLLKDCADKYLDLTRKWQDATEEGCETDSLERRDNCYVHTNSGVLNKWFYLISNGGTADGITVASLGMRKAEKITFFAEMMLTPRSGFEAARNASINAVGVLAAGNNTLNITAADIPPLKDAWKAVGVFNDTIFNMANTPMFSANNNESFNTIAAGAHGYIWAGTSNKGLYRYSGAQWDIATSLTNNNISDIKTDPEGRIWIAQYGRSGTQALSGGINMFSNESFDSYKYYTASDGLPTRNIRCIYIDRRLAFDTFKRVWAAAFGDLEGSTSRPGAIARGNSNRTILDITYKPFGKFTTGVSQTNGFCQTIGGNTEETWTFASNNTSTGTNQIVRYNIATGSFNGVIDASNSPLSSNSTVKAIYYDPVGKRWWLGLLTGGLLVRDSATQTWIPVNFPALFPAGTVVNNHAITGDSKGNIYIGTSNGLVKFGKSSSVRNMNPANEEMYTLYTVSGDGLPSNNVKGLFADERKSRLLIATDAGIMFKYNLCKECINAKPIYTIAAGNWDDPAVWEDGIVPNEYSVVVVRHNVVVNETTACKSLTVKLPGSITVNQNVNFKIQGIKYETTGR